MTASDASATSSSNVQSAVYGTLAAAIAVAGEAHDSRGAMAATIVFTLVVYAVTHAYMHTVVTPADSIPRSSGTMLRAVLAEWPLVAAGLPMLVVLGIASALDLNVDRSAEFALVAAVIVLFGWGAASPPLRADRRRRVSAGVFAAVLGVLVVAFAVWLRH